MRLLNRAALLAAGAAMTFSAFPALASSHREAPMIGEDPTADNTDVYFFRSGQDPSKVVLVANYIPHEEPSGGPNYYTFSDRVLYEIHVDRNNDGVEDVTFQFKFKTIIQTPNTFLNYLGPITELTTNGSTVVSGNNVNPNYNRYQTYTVTMVERGRGGRSAPDTMMEKGRSGSGGGGSNGGGSNGGGSGGRGRDRVTVLARNVIVPPNNAGSTTTPNFQALVTQAIHTIPGSSIRTYAGQVDDPFFIDLGGFFDLLRVRPFRSLHVANSIVPLPDRPEAPDMLSGFNCHTITMEVPITALTGTSTVPDGSSPQRILGVYASASRQQISVLRDDRTQDQGQFVQVSRLGAPLVNELFIPIAENSGRTKDAWNRSEPRNDQRFARFFQFPEPALRLAQLYPALRPVIPNIQYDQQGNPTGFTGPRNDLLGGATPLLDFVPDLLRLDVSVAPNLNGNRLGALGGDAAGFPNGRRLIDDVTDIFMRAAAGALVPGTITVGAFTGTRGEFLQSINFGDGVDTHENGRVGFQSTFPFLPIAHNGTNPAHIGFDDPEREGTQGSP